MSGAVASIADAIAAARTYVVRCAAGHPTIHFIGNADFSPGHFSVAVSSAFGSAHRLCVSQNGMCAPLPAGAAHLAEHVVLFRHWRGRITALDRNALAVNGRVDPDRTIWWAKRTWLSPPDAVAKVLALFLVPMGKSALPRLLEEARTDVGNEIDYRTRRGEFLLWTALFRALYPSHPLGDNPLGTMESLESMRVDDLRVALDALAAGTSTVCVMTPKLDAALIETVEGAIAAVVARYGRRPTWTAAATPLDGTAPVGQVWIDNEQAFPRVAVAYELEPVSAAYSDRKDRARMLVAMLLADSYLVKPVNFVSTSQTRLALAAREVPRLWLRRDLRELLHSELRSRLERWRKHFDGMTAAALAFLKEDAHASMRLCHQGVLHEIRFDELIAAMQDLSPDDVDRLLAELRGATRSAQVYVGPELVALD